MRKFEHVKEEHCKGSEGTIPTRSTKFSAGYDLVTPVDFTIHPKETKWVYTNVKAKMNSDEYLKIVIRSSMALKKDLGIKNQVAIIDADYYSNPDNDGNIIIPIYNMGNEVKNIESDTRIAQGIFKKYLTVDNEESIDNERTGGAGSTGEK